MAARTPTKVRKNCDAEKSPVQKQAVSAYTPLMTDEELATLLREVYNGDIGEDHMRKWLKLCRTMYILPKDLFDEDGYEIDAIHLPDNSPENVAQHARLSAILEELESRGLYYDLCDKIDGTGYEFGEFEGTRRSLPTDLVDAVVHEGKAMLRTKRRKRR